MIFSNIGVISRSRLALGLLSRYDIYKAAEKNAWTTQKKKVKHHQKDISNIKLVTVELTSDAMTCGEIHLLN